MLPVNIFYHYFFLFNYLEDSSSILFFLPNLLSLLFPICTYNLAEELHITICAQNTHTHKHTQILSSLLQKDLFSGAYYSWDTYCQGNYFSLFEEANIVRKTVKKLIKVTDCQGSSLKLSTVTLSLSNGKIPKLLWFYFQAFLLHCKINIR